MDVGTLSNHLKSFVSYLLLSCSFIFLHYVFYHSIRANRLMPIINFWVNSFVSLLFCNLFYFILFYFQIILLALFYFICPCLFETFRQAPSSPTAISFLDYLLHGSFGFFQPITVVRSEKIISDFVHTFIIA